VRYIVVSERVPKGLKRFCAFCITPITEGYVRDLEGTRIIYCKAECWEDHKYKTEQALIEDAARRVS